MRRLLLAVLLLVVALPAWGATVWISPTGNASNNGADSTDAHARTLAWALTSAPPGTTIQMRNGTYPDANGILPKVNGTSGSRITFCGNETAPTAVVVAGIQLGDGTGNAPQQAGHGNFITVKWVSSSASVIGFYNVANLWPESDSLRKITTTTQTNQFYWNGRNCKADSMYLTGTISGGYQPAFIFAAAGRHETLVNGIIVDRGGWDSGAVNNTFTNSVLNITINETTTDCFFMRFAAAAYDTFSSNIINETVVAASGYCFPAFDAYETYNTQINGNTWNVNMQVTPGGTHTFLALRDSSSYDRFTNNYVHVYGAGQMSGLMISNGGSWQDGRGNNYFGGNTLLFDNPATDLGGVYLYSNIEASDSVMYNVVACGNTAPCFNNTTTASATVTGLVLSHNTFFTGGPNVVELSRGSVSSATLSSNIYYGQSANGSGTETVRAITGVTLDSSGVYYNVGGTSGRAISWNGSDGSPASATHYGLTSNAVWGDPQFTSNAYSTLNTNFPNTSPAYTGTSIWGGFAGANGTAVSVTTYTITVTQATGGTISPSSAVVASGSNQTFTIAPSTGYNINNVTVDGSSQGVISSYTFSNVTQSHTITATFTLQSFTISVSAGFGGSTNPSTNQTVTYGNSQTVMVTPNSGYYTQEVDIDGNQVATQSSYTFTNVQAIHSLQAFFAKAAAVDSYTVNVSVVGGGTLNATAGGRTVTSGTRIKWAVADTATYAVTALTGYHLTEFSINGTDTTLAGLYKFGGFNGKDTTLVWTFTADSVSIVPSITGLHGSIWPPRVRSGSYQSQYSFNIVPDPFYRVSSVIVDGVSIGHVSSYTFVNLSGGNAGMHTIVASFTTSPVYGTFNWRRRLR